MSRRRKYAQDTNVSVAKSRGEIEGLLDDFGATDWSWSHSRRNGEAKLQFIWEDELTEERFLARFRIILPDDEELREQARYGGTGKFMESKYEKLVASAGKQEHRALALWLKACLVAIEEGIVTPEEIFLPFMVTKSGETVAEVARKNLPQAVSDVAGLLTE